MHNILVIGAGKIGSLIAYLLADSGDYEVHLADLSFVSRDSARILKESPKIKLFAQDVRDENKIKNYLTENSIVAVISSLPYSLTIHVAKAAKASKVHYFDLTEDTLVRKAIKEIAMDAETSFIPQCGLAPGFVNIVANSLIKEFDSGRHDRLQAKLRVGALPQIVNNALHYSLTWSTDGLINEYGNLCYGIDAGLHTCVHPLEGLETIAIDGCFYEAFNTSGGLGGLIELYLGKIQHLSYKTIRYPGHCEKMHFLMNGLKLNDDRHTLKRILEAAIPHSYQDLVIIYVTVEGIKHGSFTEKSYLKKVYPAIINGFEWSAIQISTASSICVIVDLVIMGKNALSGFVLQENFSLTDVLNNRFGKYYV